jgi:hypothetical protein
MPHPEKKQKLDCHQINDAVVAASFDDLVDVLPNILGFLPPEDVMRQRRVRKNCNDATRKTVVPLTEFRVASVERYNAMSVMMNALPNLQQIWIGYLGHGHKYNDGEDPVEELADNANCIVHDIGIFCNFSKLCILNISYVGLNGRYPFLFNSFPLLQKLTISGCPYLKWDLGMLAGLPMLKELYCNSFSISPCVTGNINNLRVLKDTLEKVHIHNCENVEGNFMDLADFPHLKVLHMDGTAVTGDIRDIGENDFSSLESLILPKGVYGGKGYELQRISDGPDVVRAVYLLNNQRPALAITRFWYGELSRDSPDWYESVEEYDTPPFEIKFVKAGSRIGYQWETDCGDTCEVNWLDPEPDRGGSEYGRYIQELQQIESQVGLYRGFHEPPASEEYDRLYDRVYEEGEW